MQPCEVLQMSKMQPCEVLQMSNKLLSEFLPWDLPKLYIHRHKALRAVISLSIWTSAQESISSRLDECRVELLKEQSQRETVPCQDM